MSKEVFLATSHSYELTTYSTRELIQLFNDWLSEIENEALTLLIDKQIADPEMIAQQLRVKKDSALFILNKLAREGRVNVQVKGK